MKTKMKSKILAIAIPFAVALFLMPLMAEKVNAESYIDTQGIKYELYESYELEGGKARVLDYQDTNLSGEITIPSTINANDSVYTVTEIMDSAFMICDSLEKINIPSTVTSIGEDAFGRCITSITVDAGNQIYSSEDGVLYDKAKTTLITCPVGKTGEIDVPASVTTIEKNACEGTKLQKISFSQDSKLTTIKEQAFFWGTELTSINIPSSVTSIGESAFYSCKSLESITIPPNITNIEKSTFNGCASLRDITIPSSVKSIGGYAFGSCSNITKISIPSSVNSIGGYAFAACSNLTKIIIPCDFDKNIFSNSYVIPSQSDDTFMISNTETTGTFEYLHEFENASYQWSDDFSNCRATGTCSKSGHEGTEDATVHIQKNEIGNWPKSENLLHIAEFTQSGFDVQIKRELFCSTKLNGEDIDCIVQDPNDAIPVGTYLKATLVEPGTDRWNELYGQLDDTSHIKNVAFLEIDLLYVENDDPVPMPLTNRARMLIQIPSGWDKNDMETVLVASSSDLEFEEEFVTKGGVDYLAFYTDHMGAYAMIDKLKENEPTPDIKPIATPIAKATARGKNALTIGWDKVEGAEGYDIFFSRCDHKGKKVTVKNVKTIKGNKIFSWTKKGLKKKTAYKAYIKAYVIKDGKKKYISKSPDMHAYTGGFTKKYTNAKAVKVNKTKVTLKQGKKFNIKAKVIKLKKNKKLMPASHVAKVRYISSDKTVATVSKSGKITAKGKGTCTIVAFAHNGVSKNIKVTVK